MIPSFIEVMADVAAEREYQDQRWGGATHDDRHSSNDWVSYFPVYLGRAASAFWDNDGSRAAYQEFRTAMVKVAALAVAAIQWADRKLES